MTSSQQLIDKYIWRTPHRANHWHSWKLMFSNYSHKYNPFLVFHKDVSHSSIYKVAYSKLTIKVPRKVAKICPKLTKTCKRHDRHWCRIPVVKETFVCRVDVPLIFKNVRRRKKVYNKCKSEKIPKADSAPRNRS